MRAAHFTNLLHAIAEKLRPYAQTLWSYAEKLRPYAQTLRSYAERLRPYAIELRRRAVRALGPVGILLHRGIVRVGSASPRAGKELEALEAWVGQSDARKLGTAAPTALSCEASGKIVQAGNRSDLDDTRYAGLAWGIIATVLAYPSGWISGKARAIEWLERALAARASIHALAATGEDDSIAAEALLALRSHPELARE